MPIDDITKMVTPEAAIIGSVATVIYAVGKLGPFINALNKFLAERHKRTLAASKDVPDKKPSTPTTRPVTLAFRNLRFASIAIFLANLALLCYQFFAVTTPPTVSIIINCMLNIAMMVIAVMVILWVSLLEILAMIYLENDKE